MASQILPSDPLSELSRSPSPPPTNHEAGLDDSPPPIRPPRRHKPHRKHRTIPQKVEHIYTQLRETRLDIWDLLWGLSERDLHGAPAGTSPWARFIDRLHGEDGRLLEKLVRSPGTGKSHLSAMRSRQLEALDRLDWGQQFLRQEALSVAGLPCFKEWHKDQPNTIENLNIDDILGKIQTAAPHLFNLLDNLIQPDLALRRHRPIKQRQPFLVGIFATICYCQQRFLANGLHTQLGLYLHASGAKRSVIQVLARLGICVGYDKILDCIKQLRGNGLEAIKTIGQAPNVVTGYDNLEQVEGVRHQRIDNEKETVSVTTGYAIQGADIPDNGLTQSMLDYSTPLEAADILDAPSMENSSPVYKEIRRYLVYNAIQTALPSTVDSIYAQQEPPTMPAIDRLPLRRTQCHSLGPIDENESTTKGNQKILKNIFLDQYGLPAEWKPGGLWDKGLRLIYGDQKTWARLWNIKRNAAIEQDLPGYGQMRWMLPIPALFHLKMNFLKIIHQTHWEANPPPKIKKLATSYGDSEDSDAPTTSTSRAAKGFPESPSFLKNARDFWQRKDIGQNAKHNFWALEEFIIHNFQARIMAGLWMRLERHTGKKILTKEGLDEVASKLQPSEFDILIDKISEDYLYQDPGGEQDAELQNHMRFLQMVEPYLILKHGVKWGDVDLIQWAIDRMCIYFHGSNSKNYALLTLFWQHHTRADASSKELSKAILSNSLVNITGRPDGWKEIDMFGEHHNNEMKAIYHDRQSSRFDFRNLFEYASLNSRFFKELKRDIRAFFGVRVNDEHTNKSAATDVLTYAERLQESSMRRQVRSGIKSVSDLWQVGLARLYQQVKKYNATLPTNRAETEEVQEAATALIDLAEELEMFYESNVNDEDEDIEEIQY